MKPTRMRAKALGVGARGRSGDDDRPRDEGARKQRGIAKQKIETGCVVKEHQCFSFAVLR